MGFTTTVRLGVYNIGEENHGKTGNRGVAGKGEDHWQISGQGLRRSRPVWGHIRDLPKSQLGIDVEHDYAPQYINIKDKSKLIKELKAKAKQADGVLLATDPDREGEASAGIWLISWGWTPTSPTA